jgi:hypothetical protein
MPESRLVPFRGRCHVLAGDLLLVDHLGHLLSVSFLPDEDLSKRFIQLLEILAKPFGSFFVEFTNDIFQSVNQRTARLRLTSAIRLPPNCKWSACNRNG